MEMGQDSIYLSIYEIEKNIYLNNSIVSSSLDDYLRAGLSIIKYLQ